MSCKSCIFYVIDYFFNFEKLIMKLQKLLASNMYFFFFFFAFVQGNNGKTLNIDSLSVSSVISLLL